MTHLRTCFITMLALSSAPLLAAARDGGAPAFPAVQPSTASVALSRRIEGLWDEQVVQVDCRTGDPIRTIGRGTNLFVRGGSLVATNNAPPTVMGVTLGRWRHAGGRKYLATMRLNLFQPPAETFVAVREIRRAITLSHHGHRLEGVVHTQDYLPEGAPLGDPICARETGVRVPAP